MQKHYLTLNCTQSESESRLKQQLRVYPPKGIVGENSFKLYKHTPGKFLGRGMQDSLFCFYGNYQQSGKYTHVSYRIRPGFSIFLFYLLLSLFTLFMWYRIIFIDEEMITGVILLGFLLLFTLITHLEKRKCIADFEKRLTSEVHYHK